jgi:hypothetical protein
MRKMETPPQNVRCIAKSKNIKNRSTNAFVLRHCQTILCILSSWAEGTFQSQDNQIARRSPMPAVAEILSTVASRPDPRGCDLPTCPVCADTMVAAEASAYLSDHAISYLWTCDTCGYGFVTKHSVKRFACN